MICSLVAAFTGIALGFVVAVMWYDEIERGGWDE